MAGPVYDAAARRLDLWSLARVTDDNGDWLRHLLAAGCGHPAGRARLLAPVLAEAAGALLTSEHPESGGRELGDGDGIASAAAAFVIAGDRPCAWAEAEFADAVDNPGPPVVAAAAEGLRFSAEFPFGDTTSQCRIVGDQPHPLYGSGLLVLQSFPIDTAETEADGATGAVAQRGGSHRRADRIRQLRLGDGMVNFSGFVPNALYKPGLLRVLVASCAARAQAMAARFVDGRWDADRYCWIPPCSNAECSSDWRPHRSSN